MKKRFGAVAGAVMAVIVSCSAFAAGCSGGEQYTPNWTVQYTDDAGTHSVSVTVGKPYSLETIPERTGYDFLGLFDAEVGGTQHVSANGSSLASFTGGKSLVLFPQFKAKEYTVILDYQGAAVTGERQYTVTYDTSLPALPKDLALEHKEFTGWYTAENCGGMQVADKYGLIPVVSVLTEASFDVSGKFINLYAGFKTETHTVTCHFSGEAEDEELQVEYGTPVSQIVPKTRIDGMAPIAWSKSEDGEAFSGKITGDIDLYALEYAPILELDSDGGDKYSPIIARAGDTLKLPTPEKDLAKFMYWADESGNEFKATTMPADGGSLKAVWQAKIVFDTNGGTEVTDISEKAGENITLPSTEKEGFIFAGWYTTDKTQYTSTKMPSAGVALKAGWYKEKTAKKDFLSGTDKSSIIGYKTPRLKSNYDINFTEIISEVDWTKTVNVILEFHADIRHTYDTNWSLTSYATKEHFYFYTQPKVNDAYFVEHIIVDHGNGSVNENYVTCKFETQIAVTGGMLYTALAADKDVIAGYSKDKFSGWQMKNFWAEIHYPDTSKLYL